MCAYWTCYAQHKEKYESVFAWYKAAVESGSSFERSKYLACITHSREEQEKYSEVQNKRRSPNIIKTPSMDNVFDRYFCCQIPAV